MRALLKHTEPKRTSDLASQVGLITKTAGRILDDLALLGIANRTKMSSADNSPDLWEATPWLREYWPSPPEKVRQKRTRGREGEPLGRALDVFGRWLHVDDDAPVLAVAATVIANLEVGDPVWLLLVGPPSSGKTEILQSITGLSYVASAATITEASLLSGTSAKERARDATGGLLRQICEFGILLAKDFTSVLSQNRDTLRAAMSAMREVYDGAWHRPVGTDGGKVLRWEGKCGFIGGVTPSYDRYGAITNALGDRFVLLRLPEVDPDKQARAALAQAKHERQMRAELAEAMTTLINSSAPRTSLSHFRKGKPSRDR